MYNLKINLFQYSAIPAIEKLLIFNTIFINGFFFLILCDIHYYFCKFRLKKMWFIIPTTMDLGSYDIIQALILLLECKNACVTQESRPIVVGIS